VFKNNRKNSERELTENYQSEIFRVATILLFFVFIKIVKVISR